MIACLWALHLLATPTSHQCSPRHLSGGSASCWCHLSTALPACEFRLKISIRYRLKTWSSYPMQACLPGAACCCSETVLCKELTF